MDHVQTTLLSVISVDIHFLVSAVLSSDLLILHLLHAERLTMYIRRESPEQGNYDAISRSEVPNIIMFRDWWRTYKYDRLAETSSSMASTQH